VESDASLFCFFLFFFLRGGKKQVQRENDYISGQRHPLGRARARRYQAGIGGRQASTAVNIVLVNSYLALSL
jgi:hypothetical protein